VGSVAVTFAPAIGLWLVGGPTGFAGVFVACAGAAALAHVGTRLLQRELPARDDDRPVLPFDIRKAVDRRVLPVSVLLICLMVPMATNAFIPLFARELGIENVGLYYVVSSLAGIGSRLFFGKATDRTSREMWIAIGFALAIAGLVVIRASGGIEQLILGGGVFALGMAAANPMLLALAIDVGGRERPGAAMATFSASYQIGPAIGAPGAGLLIEHLGYPSMYVGAIAVAALGLVLTLLRWQQVGRARSAEARGVAEALGEGTV
jgi:predicted MFS family arabinose efflux permease